AGRGQQPAPPRSPGGAAQTSSGTSRMMNNIANARAAGAQLNRADDAMGDVAGDRWTNREPDLGRSTIPR
ncbi:MAG: hypothetical protein J2P18_12070, partial [Nocardia sp.]|nr:hypothetical protein [Nocardia sp.]